MIQGAVGLYRCNCFYPLCGIAHMDLCSRKPDTTPRTSSSWVLTVRYCVPTRLEGVAAQRLHMLVGLQSGRAAVSAWVQRYTTTGSLECVSTFCVTLPMISAEILRRPCEAMKITSHFCFFAALMIPS